VKDKLAAREVKEGDIVGVFVSEKHQHASMSVSGLFAALMIQIKPATANEDRGIIKCPVDILPEGPDCRAGS
jgi:hypothetical protein